MRTDIKEAGLNKYSLYPCPKCGLTSGSYYEMVGRDPIENYYFMKCACCGFAGPHSSTPEKAWEAWWNEAGGLPT